MNFIFLILEKRLVQLVFECAFPHRVHVLMLSENVMQEGVS